MWTGAVNKGWIVFGMRSTRNAESTASNKKSGHLRNCSVCGVRALKRVFMLFASVMRVTLVREMNTKKPHAKHTMEIANLGMNLGFVFVRECMCRSASGASGMFIFTFIQPIRFHLSRRICEFINFPFKPIYVACTSTYIRPSSKLRPKRLPSICLFSFANEICSKIQTNFLLIMKMFTQNTYWSSSTFECRFFSTTCVRCSYQSE